MAAVLIAGVIATGCSSTDRPTATPTTTAPTIAVTSTTLDPARQQVLDGYRRYWEIYIAVGGEMNLPDARLAEVATGEELHALGGAFLAYKVDGEVFRGTIDLAPAVTALDGDKATIVDCYRSEILGYDAVTGQAKGTARPGRTLVTVSMEHDSDTWKVAAIRHEGDGCVP